MPYKMNNTELMADKYITWSVDLADAAINLESKGGDGSRLRKMSAKSAKKALALLA